MGTDTTEQVRDLNRPVEHHAASMQGALAMVYNKIIKRCFNIMTGAEFEHREVVGDYEVTITVKCLNTAHRSEGLHDVPSFQDRAR